MSFLSTEILRHCQPKQAHQREAQWQGRQDTELQTGSDLQADLQQQEGIGYSFKVGTLENVPI